MTKVSKADVFEAVAKDNGFHPAHKVTGFDWWEDDEIVFVTNRHLQESEHYSVDEFIRQMSNYFTIEEGCNHVDMVCEGCEDWFVFDRMG